MDNLDKNKSEKDNNQESYHNYILRKEKELRKNV
jgi:hypothetical protein